MPKKFETEPISDDEWLFRRVHTSRFRTNKTPYVSPGAFEPRVKGNDPDDDGISLFRSDCLETAEEILAQIHDAEKRNANGIVKLLVSEVKAIGLTVIATPREGIRGHVSIPEMSSQAFSHKDSRLRCEEWMYRLAEFASPEDRIVVPPIPLNPRNK